jgi:hypothetical protein
MIYSLKSADSIELSTRQKTLVD